jgi:uncharacterized protein (TIGR02246 family)
MAAAPESNKERDEAHVLHVEERYDRAWREGDVDALVGCFTENAVLMNPRGEVARGRDEIRRALGEFLAGPAKGSKHSSEVVRLEFITDDVAIVDGEATVEDVALDDERSTVRHRFTDVLVRQGETWLIAHVRAYE